MERDAPVNPKYRYDEVFDRVPFEGTTEKMDYGNGKSPRKKGKGKQFTPERNCRPESVIKPRVDGGPNMDFLNKHGLDEYSHPMDWFNALLSMSPKDNRKDPLKANVKGDRRTKFAVSN